jgi:hypothetical protein
MVRTIGNGKMKARSENDFKQGVMSGKDEPREDEQKE